MSLTLCKHEFKAMGSPCSIWLYIPAELDCQRVLDAVHGEIIRLERKFSRYRDDSLTSKILAAAMAGDTIVLDQETAGLLDYADTLWHQSDGLFDITSGVLRQVWDFSRDTIPGSDQVEAVLPLIGWQRLNWQNPALSFPYPGMEVDFGGYVKEYAADSAAAVAQQFGVRHGLIELGGDIRVVGAHPDGRPWQVGVRHPRQAGAVLAQVDVNYGAVASSGDYERAIVFEGKRYGHILNPQTGWPVSGLAAVSVVADHCLLAGTACTVAMLKGEEGADWLDGLGVNWIAMNDHGEVLGNMDHDMEYSS